MNNIGFEGLWNSEAGLITVCSTSVCATITARTDRSKSWINVREIRQAQFTQEVDVLLAARKQSRRHKYMLQHQGRNQGRPATAAPYIHIRNSTPTLPLVPVHAACAHSMPYIDNDSTYYMLLRSAASPCQALTDWIV